MLSPDANDIVPPDDYLFILDSAQKVGHLAASDDERPLPLCGAGGSGITATTLSAPFAVCPACQTIADEASSRPF